MQQQLTDVPYGQYIDGLLLSIAAAQLEVLLCTKDDYELKDHLHWAINRHFSWIVLELMEGKDRHLREPPPGLASLAVEKLRKKSLCLQEVPSLKNPGGFPLNTAPTGFTNYFSKYSEFAQRDATRISALVIASIKKVEQDRPILIEHPLSVLRRFLTSPALPSSAAYATIGLRAYLVSAILLNTIPPKHNTAPVANPANLLTPSDIVGAVSAIHTSLRDRPDSRGRDTFGFGSGASSVVRHHLASRGVLDCYFQDFDIAVQYLKSGKPVSREGVDPSSTYLFVKSEALEQLPNPSEIENELLGIPIPIEGADSIFRGGLRLADRGSLVISVQGEPGTGKTSLALALCAYLAPLGIPALYLTSEEASLDLQQRLMSVIPEELRRLSFFPSDLNSLITFDVDAQTGVEGVVSSNGSDTALSAMDKLRNRLSAIAEEMDATDRALGPQEIAKPCKAIIVLDGLHDLFVDSGENNITPKESQLYKLYELIATARRLGVLVVVTTGSSLGEVPVVRLDHLVDVAIKLSNNDSVAADVGYSRYMTLSKARHQLCSPGTHGFNVASASGGVQFLPQTWSDIERRSIWKTQLPNKQVTKLGLSLGVKYGMQSSQLTRLSGNFVKCTNAISIYDNSHIFIHGHGSGGKAALALKIAFSSIAHSHGASGANPLPKLTPRAERVLIVSFLYPEDYYKHIVAELNKVRTRETKDLESVAQSNRDFAASKSGLSFRLDVLHLRPGFIRPNELFRKIDERLTDAENSGIPHTCVVLEGIHNVYLQFPEIERYRLFWAQLYSSLRTRPVTTITTHSTLALPSRVDRMAGQVDDLRSEPLRQSLVQKTDYQIEVDPVYLSPYITPQQKEALGQQLIDAQLYTVKAISAVERIPEGFLLWDRRSFEIADPPKEMIRQNPQQSLFG
jgi:KaiC/GvpD/RAD55 family RecA-like ATPase